MGTDEPGSAPIADPVDAYRQKILNFMGETTDDRHKERIIILSFNDGDHNRPLPTESISLNYEKIEYPDNTH